MSYLGNNINIGIDKDTAGADAFGRFRVSQPRGVFNWENVQGSGHYYWDNVLSGGGTATYDEDRSAVILNVGTADGDAVVRQTRQYWKYEAGRSQLIINTCAMPDSKNNLVRRVGLFDDDDGIFFERDGTTNYWVLRSSTSGVVTERRIQQDDWNIDIMGGSGISGGDINPENASLYAIDFQWLGVGRVRCGFALADGRIVYAHSFENAGKFGSVYMKKPHLPVRFEIRNQGITSGASSFETICSTIFSEGGQDIIGEPGATNTGATSISISTPEEALLAVRAKSGSNRTTLVPTFITAGTSTADEILIRVYICRANVAGSYTSVSANAEAQVNPAAIPSDKVLIDSFYVTSTSRLTSQIVPSALNVNSNYAGSRECLLITGQSFAGAASVFCSANWVEQ